LSAATFRGYFRTCKNIIDFFGRDRRVDDLRPSDFADFRSALSRRLGVGSLKHEINKSRIIFRFALKQKFISAEVDYGESFQKPAQKVIRRDRREAGKRNFTLQECLRILDACDPVMRAMFLLGLNCGFGNFDCSSLPQSAIDWETGWVEHPRAKTEIFRRCKLWPETLETLRTALELRPVPLDDADADLIFLNKRGKHWVRMESKKKTDTDEIGKNSWVPYDDVTECFSRLLKKLGINGRRSLGFYSARRTFATAGSEAKDPDALRSLMGHSDSSQTGLYVQEISDERLQAVTDTVRSWLWPRSEKGGDA
jgi:integrase